MYQKIILIFFSLIFFSFAYSQINYGIKGGVTESYLHSKIKDYGENYGLRTGYQTGIFAEIPLSERINLQPSIQLTQKGFKEVKGAPGTSFYWSRNFSTNYLELPLNIAYNFKLKNKTVLQFGTGPVFGIGLFGKNITDLSFFDDNQQQQNEHLEGTDAFSKRFDFGWDFLLRFKYKRMSIGADYNYGLFNLLNDGDHKAYNRNFALTVGYLLKTK